jgi:hypothetical protein
MPINVRDYGAAGDGHTDDTAAIAAAYVVAHTGTVHPLYFPAGQYLVTSWPTLASHDVITGDGSDLSMVIYAGSGYLISMANLQRVRVSNMGFWITGAAGCAVSLANCFGCSFDSVVFRGTHASANYPTYINTVGVFLTGNTGGTVFTNCDFNNFGYGLRTNTIQNYLQGFRFHTCYIGVHGTGSNFGAGLSLMNGEFVSRANSNDAYKHICIDGPVNDWWISHVWFEGVNTALDVGVAATGGPAQFGMVNCKVAASGACLKLNNCRQAYLANVRFDKDPGSTPAELTINGTHCAEGVALGLISSQTYDLPSSVFPHAWNVLGRGTARPAS